MKRKLLNLRKGALALIAFSILFFEASSQNWVPGVNVPAPTSIEDYKRCDQEMVGAFDTRTFKACLDGQKQARYTAEQFALTNGKLHGYLEGFSYALFHAAEANKQNADEMARGEQALLANGPDMQTGIDQGVESGMALGAENGERDALALWSQAFADNKAPVGSASTFYTEFVPEFFMDISSPYEYYIGRKSVEDIMREDIDQSLRRVVVNIPDQQVYLVSNYRYNTWDLWFDQGRYEVQRYKSGGWINPDESFNFWKKYSEKLGQYDINSYSNLPIQYTDKVAKVEKEVNNPDGTTKTIMVNATVNLREIFKDAFLESYRYYMNHNFNKGFHEYLKMGAFAGEAVGIQVGKRMAFENGYAQAYDNKFWYDAEQAYLNSYKAAYAQAFDRVYNEYAKNAVLAVLQIETIGEINDGILSPGERVKFKVNLENRGAVNSRTISAIITGDISGSITESLGSLNSFENGSFETDYVLQISESHNVKEHINLDFKFESSNAIAAFCDTKIDIQNQIEATGPARITKLDIVNGTATIVLPIKNVSTRPASNISAEAIVNGSQIGVSNLGEIAGLSQAQATVVLTDLNPLELIDGVDALIYMTTNESFIEDAEGSTVIRSKDVSKDIAAIFLSAFSGSVLVTSSEVESKLLELNNQEVMSVKNGSNIYKRNPSSTIPGQLIAQRNKGSVVTEKALNDLAIKMWRLNEKSLPSFLSTKRKYYQKLLDELTISGNVKKAAK
ncbi:MAG: hypothetical protein JXQ87_14980 [Bacteroidia bacterium]